jgi:hypothetical protein
MKKKIFLVTDSSKIKKDILEQIREQVNAKMIFCDFQKMEKPFSIFGGLELLAPKFWEFLAFSKKLAHWHDLSLSNQEFQDIELTIEKNIDVYWRLFSQLSHFKGGGNKNIVQEIIKEHRHFDQFKLTEFLNTKRKNELLGVLLEIKGFQQLESLCSFLVTHGLKILDPSDILKKKNLSKFDNGIIQAGKAWGEKELIAFVAMLKRVSYLSRAKNKEAFIELMKAVNF